jgi:hypothetical protein
MFNVQIAMIDVIDELRGPGQMLGESSSNRLS